MIRLLQDCLSLNNRLLMNLPIIIVPTHRESTIAFSGYDSLPLIKTSPLLRKSQGSNRNCALTLAYSGILTICRYNHLRVTFRIASESICDRLSSRGSVKDKVDSLSSFQLCCFFSKRICRVVDAHRPARTRSPLARADTRPSALAFLDCCHV